MHVMTDRMIRETTIIAIMAGHLQYDAFMQLSQLEKEFLTVDASPMISRGRRLATITSPTLLLILRSIAVVI